MALLPGDLLITAARNVAKCPETISRLDDIRTAAGYAEPGYDDPDGFVFFGNWNRVSYNRGNCEDDTMKRLAELLEKAGHGVEWDDEWVVCYACGKAARTQPTCYGWTRSFVFLSDNTSICCHECLMRDKGELKAYLDHLEGALSLVPTFINLEEQGYTQVGPVFEHGLHGGQAADPRKIAPYLSRFGVTSFLFQMYEASQFSMSFRVFVRDEDVEKTEHLTFSDAHVNGPDPAEMCKKALSSGQLGGPGTISTLNLNDGSVDVKDLKEMMHD